MTAVYPNVHMKLMLTTSCTTASVERAVYQDGGVTNRDVEVEAGSGPFSVETEAQKFYRFCIHIGYLTSRVTGRKKLSISQCGLNGEVALEV